MYLFPLVEGIVYHVTLTCKGYGVDSSVVLSYKLKEFNQKFCWDCDRFIPLSDRSETEMVRNYQLNKEPASIS